MRLRRNADTPDRRAKGAFPGIRVLRRHAESASGKAPARLDCAPRGQLFQVHNPRTFRLP